MILNLATTGSANFPIWMESHSGNASDKKILPDAVFNMNALCTKLAQPVDFLYVADSAILIALENEEFYFRDFAEKNIKNGANIKYIQAVLNINLHAKAQKKNLIIR